MIEKKSVYKRWITGSEAIYNLLKKVNLKNKKDQKKKQMIKILKEFLGIFL